MAQAPFHLLMRNALSPIEFRESPFDFRQKHKPLDRVVKGGAGRKVVERLDDLIARALLRRTS